MEFRQLQYILTIAREGSLLAASEKLFITPSALSQFVGRLENELGTPLFKRTRSGWVPTYAGKIYLEMAEDILQKEQNACRRISDIADNQAGCFTVGVTSGRGTRMFASVFPKFKAMHPHVKVELFEGTVMEINDRIAGGQVDVGFITSILEHPKVRTIHQADEQIVLAVPKSHPLAPLARNAPVGGLATVELKLFAGDEFLLAGEGTTLRALADSAFEAAGFLPKITFETQSLSTLHTLARSGFGLSFVPRFYVSDHSEAVYFHTDPPLSWQLVAACRVDGYLTRAEEAFIRLATEYYRATQSPQRKNNTGAL